ncbi:MAG: hypothetical protein ACREDO_12650 [Methyloceanibacter sp.]
MLRVMVQRAAFAAGLCLSLLIAAQTPVKGGELLAYIDVAGAPGDGDQALAAALARQLASRGIESAGAPAEGAYEMQGTVRVAPGPKGKQIVDIIWVVLGPDGGQLGVTRQTKDIRKGSLDRRWGPAADAAAHGAAQDIFKLLPNE